MKRRDFMIGVGATGLCLSVDFPRVARAWAGPLTFADDLSDHEARYYKKLEQLIVECELCPRKCKVADLERGYCGVRENRDGRYRTLVYGRPCSMNVDPIEKKPFFHFLPGTTAFSVATAGCNVNCKFCQNWEISQVRPEQTRNMDLPPKSVVDLSLRYGAPTIAYTYSEPVVFYEYMYDTAVAGRKKGLRSVMISGGYINKEPLVDLVQVLDAVKIDLKGFTEDYYNKICNGELKPILDCLVTLAEQGIWTEIVYLVVPTLNDDTKDISAMGKWIVKNLGDQVPVHFSRFHPMYLLKNLPSTPVKTLEDARKACLDAGVKYVYIGNVPGHAGENTYCPSCGELLIKRVGYTVELGDFKAGVCLKCQEQIPGVWK